SIRGAVDVLDIRGLGHARHLIEIADVVRQIWELGDSPPVALEVRVIDSIETYQSAEQPPVGLRDRVTNQVAVLRQDLLNFLKRVENIAKGLLVRRLTRRKTGTINTIIDVRSDYLLD